MKNNEITKRPDMSIFDKQFPVRLIDAPIDDPTKFTILTGDDGILDDLFSYQVYNKIKNHWRAAAVPADIQPGMIWSDSDDDKLYHHGAADEEILQLTRSFDVNPQFAMVRLMDTGADHYLQLKCNENLSGNRTLNLILSDLTRTISLSGNLTLGGALATAADFTTQNNDVIINAVGAARTITLNGSPTLDDWFDQAVKVASSPTFANVLVTNTFRLNDTGADHYLQLRCNEDLSGNRTLNIILSDATRTLTVSGNASIDQDTRTTATPSFDHLTLTSATSTITGGTKLSIECGVTGVHSATIRDDTSVAAANVRIDATTGGLRRSTAGNRKYKDNIEDLELDTSFLYRLRPVSFNSKCKSDDKKKRYHGLIADEVLGIYPDAVEYNKEKEPEAIDYREIQMVMLKEIQKHEAKFEAMESRLIALEGV